ncbi:hypothetical protein [Streptomyces rugosispiralis]|uniref:Uncharacterized protein n=1 Tax=Streptomyces rugosispiralis TaxID=2967341 RepID=A0ABT1UQT6_9ACTN|nr:hypothetical protein [Streptomyces rugosispiralis]MCQ8187479.1 hypothetical protein [Streptomyces rugosispiralis]
MPPRYPRAKWVREGPSPPALAYGHASGRDVPELLDSIRAHSDAPGLGVELDTEAAGRFPYQPAYLPVNRLADGTVHDW